MKLYNTLTRNVDEFKTNQEGIVNMYTCGPTVYHYAHIGNLRSYVMEDVLEKSLTYIGYKVNRVMNITDVGHLTSDADSGEDKMVKGAIREHKTVMEIAKYYTDCFFDDMKKLNIKRPETVVPATSCIPEYIHMIEVLLGKGYAYIAGGNVYFDTSKLDEYYKLTNHNKDELLQAVRDDVNVDENKKNKNDFVLWFTKSKFEDQQLKWESPWGIGYPGWHIECSNIALKYLGEYLDIHCGGVDNIFPHHTNEIAQTEAYTGHAWCNYWFHVEHLNDKRGKMSKSSGEFLTLSVLEEKNYNPLAYRLFLLGSHYRKVLLFDFEELDKASNTYNKLKNKISLLKSEGNIENIEKYQEQFKEAINNDLNTSLMLTTLYDVIKADDLNDASKLYLINDFDKVLSLDLLKENKKSVDKELEEYINDAIERRKVAKQNKDFALADAIRNELLAKGIELKDTREGTIYNIL